MAELLDLSTKSEDHPTECEVRVDVRDGDRWVRIPVTLCELWINKDGPSDIARTAKVKFPAEWDGESITQYINGFQEPLTDGEREQLFDTTQTVSDLRSTSYDECRIWFYDSEDDIYQIAHYGYVGGVGPATETGVMKFWVYDAADLMRRIHISKSFDDPTIQQVVDFVVQGSDADGREVGLEHRSVFSDIKTYIGGLQEVKLQKADDADMGNISQNTEELADDGGAVIGPLQLDTSDLIDDIYDKIFGSEVTSGLFSGKKQFQINRHNMADLMNWFAAEVGGKWHFEPTPEGPLLFFDNSSSRGIEREDGELSRRQFVDSNLVDGDGHGDISDYTVKDVFEPVETLDNQALFDIKPFNTLHLYGESHSAKNKYGDEEHVGAVGSIYPYVKITYPPLLERSGGYEYSAPSVESDKQYIAQARREAINQFREHLTEETEGTITLTGEPYILPFDYLKTVATCNETYSNADMVPITYEVNSVKHSRSATDRYKTELGVSLTFDESKLEITSEYREG